MRVVPIAKPSPTLLALLRELLRQAEAGALVSLIYSAEIAGGHVQTGLTAIEDLYASIGQLERMKVILLRELDDSAQEMT